LLLDTSVLIGVERDGFDLDELIDDADEPAVAAITIAELGVGVEIAAGKRK
jgi:tRNA(fMet)-specific endonuclease VapC